MARLILVAFLAALPGAANAQGPRAGTGNPVDVDRIPESGPAVVGGTGATAGPNSKNQAISPMPGLREEELSERPPDAALLPPSDVRPVPGAPTQAKPLQENPVVAPAR
jgi:hypothetical protein